MLDIFTIVFVLVFSVVILAAPFVITVIAHRPVRRYGPADDSTPPGIG